MKIRNAVLALVAATIVLGSAADARMYHHRHHHHMHHHMHHRMHHR